MYSDDPPLNLTGKEIDRAFADPKWRDLYPPVLTIEQVGEMLQVSPHTVRDWRSRRLLDSCSRRMGKRVRFLRDRVLLWFFNSKGGNA